MKGIGVHENNKDLLIKHQPRRICYGFGSSRLIFRSCTLTHTTISNDGFQSKNYVKTDWISN